MLPLTHTQFVEKVCSLFGNSTACFSQKVMLVINRCDFLLLINCRLIDQFRGDRVFITMCRCEKKNSNKESRCIQGYGAVCWIKPQVIFIMTFTGILKPIGNHSLLLHPKMTINPSNLCISTQPRHDLDFCGSKGTPILEIIYTPI